MCRKLAQTGWNKAPYDAKLHVQTKFDCCGFETDDQDEVIDVNGTMSHPNCIKSSVSV